MSQRVVLEASSLVNPLADAWREALDLAGLNVQPVLVGGGDLHEHDRVRGWARPSELEPDLDVQAVVCWWGLASLSHSETLLRYPHARSVVIVDTFPNASRLSTEVREVVRSFRQQADLYIGYTPLMLRRMRQLRLIRGSSEFVAMVQPFPLRMHRSVPEPTKAGIIFTGRSDHLFTTGTAMKKDALGPYLEAIRAEGVPVTLQEPQDAEYKRFLSKKGFTFYPYLTNADILDGALANIITQYEGQLAAYRVSNGTVRRRVQNGLSSRFALGLTANSPMLVQGEATDAAAMVRTLGVGASVEAPHAVPALLQHGARYRDSWLQRHDDWSAEAQGTALRLAVTGGTMTTDNPT